MIREGIYVVPRKTPEVAPMRVFVVREEPTGVDGRKVLTARVRGPGRNPGDSFVYSSHPVHDLVEVDVQLVCYVCQRAATYDNGRVATRFFCSQHARPGDRPFAKPTPDK